MQNLGFIGKHNAELFKQTGAYKVRLTQGNLKNRVFDLQFAFPNMPSDNKLARHINDLAKHKKLYFKFANHGTIQVLICPSSEERSTQ